MVEELTFAVARARRSRWSVHRAQESPPSSACIQRFYDVDSGTILVDGIDIRDLDPADLRSRFAYVEQEPVMFAGTVAENIRFGRPGATQAEVEAAARAALVHDFVTELPAGYDTIVGERGVMLSGGQKQRVAIARALFKDAPILLARRGHIGPRRAKRAAGADRPRAPDGRPHHARHRPPPRDHPRRRPHPGLEQGRLIDQGTHAELVRKGGRYAELAKLQFRADERWRGRSALVRQLELDTPVPA